MELIESLLTNNPCYQANLEPADERYAAFQRSGPRGLMLHSVGCNQPKALVFVRGWDRADYDRACVHAFVDAGTGAVWQTLPWNYRGWHCGGPGNDTHLGVELCESAALRYTGANRFEVLDRETALADCARTYRAAVELFARLCRTYGLDPRTAVCSHKEGARAGIASDHGDPEHYWSGLGTGYTMDGFRADVSAALATAAPFPKPEAPADPTPDPGTPAGPTPEAETPTTPETPTEPTPEPASPTPEPAPEAPASELPYTDVDPRDWYADALRWAVEKHIFGPGQLFRPEAPCTRALAVVLLRRLWNALQTG